MNTCAVEIFCQMCEACGQGIQMRPRSPNDKEYFAQDWFIGRLEAAALPYVQQGRNSYPDFWVGQQSGQEGYEIKSLAYSNGKPARKDIDFNSSIPSGLKQGNAVFIAFFLYTGRGSDERAIHSISVCHGDLINADHVLADEHLNVAVHRFGSYADGFIRNRKMYVFPHPISIDEDGLGRNRLIVPVEWGLSDARLRKIKTIERVVAQETVDRYTIRLRGRGEADVVSIPSNNAGAIHRFEVFEAI